MTRQRSLCFILLTASTAFADRNAPSTEEINRAIDAGVAWLKSAQMGDGSWGPCVAGSAYGGGAGGVAYRRGPTAFSIFTLAVCGVSRTDPVIERGLWWLRESRTADYEYASYESSAVVLMLTALHGAQPPKRLVRSASRIRPPKGSSFPQADWRWMDERIQHLLGCIADSGGFGYYGIMRDYADVSATQFACLALRNASFAGYPVPNEAWTGAVEFLAKLQHPTGGFPYHTGHKPSLGMTAAGLSSLLICREQLNLLGEKEPASLRATVDRATAYLDTHCDLIGNPSPHDEGRNYYHYCCLYAVERTGILAGRREFGGKGWYAQGATLLVGEQDREGRWVDDSCIMPDDILGTCFALLFLKKATIPVVTPNRGKG